MERFWLGESRGLQVGKNWTPVPAVARVDLLLVSSCLTHRARPLPGSSLAAFPSTLHSPSLVSELTLRLCAILSSDRLPPARVEELVATLATGGHLRG